MINVVGKAKMGEKEWYFFCVRDRKYPTGLRTNRATEAGYWKATGKDKEIYRGKSLVGMKKTLVFYKGRAPKGEKSDWVMHEFRLDGKFNPHNLPKSAKKEWVICRVFQKSSSGKKIHISGIMRLDSSSYGNHHHHQHQLGSSVVLPPLADCSPCKTTTTTAAYVPCFSNPIIDDERNNNQVGMFDPFGASPLADSAYTTHHQDHSILRALLQNNCSDLKTAFKAAAADSNETPPQQDLATLWNYHVQIK
ncbi:hypothetical protein PIB30_018117 [Stylosanthes scabra]|uniref:NAC domain-containing protein n=1 Tax=Stylosanthes scabra TaxID=79078 RepID=A0ABU6Z853_9FABA|nr:hypothetical protein [Stylosanthes scabra]